MSPRPRLRWSTTSKTRSFSVSGGSVARRRRPIVRWTSFLLILLDQTVRGLLNPIVLEAELLHHERRQHVLRIACGEFGQRPNQLFLDGRTADFQTSAQASTSGSAQACRCRTDCRCRRRAEALPASPDRSRRNLPSSRSTTLSVMFADFDRLKVPRPAGTTSGSGRRLLDQPLVVESQEELPDKQRVSLGLLNDEPGQRGHLGGVGLQGVAEKPGDVRKPERREREAA